MEKRILIVEDDKDLLELLDYTLVKEGYLVDRAESGSVALQKLNTFKPDLLLLDIMLPEMSGLEVCKTIKKEPKYKNIAVIILTARGREADRVAGLELGADDYMSKPFSLKELVLRIKAVLARLGRGKEELISAGPLTIDKQQHLVYKNGKKANLTFTQFKILSLLVARPGKVYSRSELLDVIWGEDVVVSDRAVDVQIKRLKDRLKEELGVDGIILTVRGVGYKFEIDN